MSSAGGINDNSLSQGKVEEKEGVVLYKSAVEQQNWQREFIRVWRMKKRRVTSRVRWRSSRGSEGAESRSYSPEMGGIS